MNEQEQIVRLDLRVFPLEGKKPPKGFRWKDQATTELVRSACYGVVAGEGKVAFIDTDTRETAIWWWKNRPRTPWVVKTPGGGGHFAYSSVGKHVPTKRGIMDKVDVRGDGGYVVGPGSAIGDKRYELVGEITLDLPPFDLAWIPEVQSVQKEVRNGVRYISHIQAISGQGGHNATFRAVCKLRDAGMDEAEALAAMVEWNRTNCLPPWTTKDLLHKVKSAFSRTSSKGA